MMQLIDSDMVHPIVIWNAGSKQPAQVRHPKELPTEISWIANPRPAGGKVLEDWTSVNRSLALENPDNLRMVGGRKSQNQQPSLPPDPNLGDLPLVRGSEQKFSSMRYDKKINLPILGSIQELSTLSGFQRVLVFMSCRPATMYIKAMAVLFHSLQKGLSHLIFTPSLCAAVFIAVIGTTIGATSRRTSAYRISSRGPAVKAGSDLRVLNYPRLVESEDGVWKSIPACGTSSLHTSVHRIRSRGYQRHASDLQTLLRSCIFLPAE